MDSLIYDVRHGLRVLGGAPGFVAAAVVSLALGIGANTAIFSITSTIFHHALAVHDISRLVEVYWVDHGTARTRDTGRLNVSYLNYRDVRDRISAFSALGCFVSWPTTLTGMSNDQPARAVSMTLVSANYFDVLGVRPPLGRTFNAEEDQHLGGDHVALLSHQAWLELFGGAMDVLNRTITLDDVQYSIIGVAPAGFKGTLTLNDPLQVWVPISMYGPQIDRRRSRQVRVFGRLNPGVDMPAALAELKTIAASLEQEYPWENSGGTFDVAPLADAALDSMPTRGAARVATALAVVVALILLMACLNVMNLLVIRSASRAREVAVRSAIGSSRVHLVRQFMVEGVLLAIGGGALGLIVGVIGSRVLWALLPSYVTSSGLELGLDSRTLLFTTAIALATTLIFALGPAVFASVPNLSALMNTGQKGGAGGRARRGLSHAVVVLQVAVAFVALAFAGLLIRSLDKAERTELGFTGGNLGVVGFTLPRLRPEEFQRRLEALVAAAAATPGVRSAAVATNAPLDGSRSRTVLSEEEEGGENVAGTITALNYVTDAYFQTMGLQPREGRLFDRFDIARGRRVAVVNEAMAQRFWPGRSPIGERFLLRSIPGVYHEIVGVIPNVVLWEIGESPQPVGYIPLALDPQPGLALHIRTDGDPAQVLPAVIARGQALEPMVAFIAPRTLDDFLQVRLWAWRAGAMLFSLFGALALLLAGVGIFGTMAYSVVQRTNELGIRLALGATRSGLQVAVLRDGTRLVLMGIAVGASGTFALTTVIRGLLYGVPPNDVVTFAGTSSLFLAVALLATGLAAARIAAIDPVQVTR